MGFFTSFLNLFRSNKTIFRLLVQDIAWRTFERRPQMKPAVLRAINNTFAQVTAATRAIDVPAMLADNIKVSGLTPPEQELVKSMITDLTSEWAAYRVKTGIVTEAEKYQSIAEIMGWIRDIAR